MAFSGTCLTDRRASRVRSLELRDALGFFGPAFGRPLGRIVLAARPTQDMRASLAVSVSRQRAEPLPAFAVCPRLSVS